MRRARLINDESTPPPTELLADATNYAKEHQSEREDMKGGWVNRVSSLHFQADSISFPICSTGTGTTTKTQN